MKIGPISKSIVSAAVGRLIDSGQLDFNQPVKSYPKLNRMGEDMSVRQLLRKEGDDFEALKSMIESISGKSFDSFIKSVFEDLGLDRTFLDEKDPLIHKRARFVFLAFHVYYIM